MSGTLTPVGGGEPPPAAPPSGSLPPPERPPDNLVRSLKEFVDTDLRGFLLFALQNFDRFAPDFLANLRSDLFAAWDEVQPNFAQAIRQIEDVDFGKLKDHGLYGVQLRLKRSAFEIANRLTRLRFQQKPAPRPKALARIIRFGLRGLDNILDSLSAAIPPLGAIAELKELIDWVAEGTEILGPRHWKEVDLQG